MRSRLILRLTATPPSCSGTPMRPTKTPRSRGLLIEFQVQGPTTVATRWYYAGTDEVDHDQGPEFQFPGNAR